MSTTAGELIKTAELPPGGGACSQKLWYKRGCWHYVRYVDGQGIERARHHACYGSIGEQESLAEWRLGLAEREAKRNLEKDLSTA